MIIQMQAFFEKNVIKPIDETAENYRLTPFVSIFTSGVRALAHSELVVKHVALALFHHSELGVHLIKNKFHRDAEVATTLHNQAKAAWQEAANEISIIFYSTLDMIPFYARCTTPHAPKTTEAQTVMPAPTEAPKEATVQTNGSSNHSEYNIEDIAPQDVQPTIEPTPVETEIQAPHDNVQTTPETGGSKKLRIRKKPKATPEPEIVKPTYPAPAKAPKRTVTPVRQNVRK